MPGVVCSLFVTIVWLNGCCDRPACKPYGAKSLPVPLPRGLLCLQLYTRYCNCAQAQAQAEADDEDFNPEKPESGAPEAGSEEV